MSVETIKKVLTVALTVAKELAKLTNTTVDDNAVALVEKVAASDVVWQIIASIFKLSANDDGGNGGNNLVMMSGASATSNGEVILTAKGESFRSEAGIPETAMKTALANADLKGFGLSELTMIIQLAMAIFKAIKK